MRSILIANFLFLFLSVSSQGLVINSGRSWMTTGNNNTVPATNFIGTIDAQDLVLRTANIERLRVLSSGNVGIGTTLPSQRLHVTANFRLDKAFMPGNTAGTIGQILRSQGPGLAPIWSDLSSYSLISNQNIPDNLNGACGSAGFFSDSVPKFLPDVSTVTVTIPVSGLPNTLCGVVFGMDITHTFDADLDISLVSPLGTVIDLTSDNGGAADNFTNTVFDDNAATSITTGAAPFTGTYQPETPFSTLNGEDPNGNWTLIIVDDLGIDVGWLNYLTLTIFSSVGGTFTYVGEATVPLVAGESVNIECDYSIKSGSTNGMAIQVTRDVVSGPGSVGTVIGYCADNGLFDAYGACGISDRDTGLAAGTYYYKLWEFIPGASVSTRNYSLIVSKIY